MSWFQHNKKPLVSAVAVFFVLFSAVVTLTIYYDFSSIDLGGLAFMLAFLCCLFVAKNTFDISMAAARSSELERTVAVDLAISSEELYIQLYKNSPVPYLILNADGMVKSANVAAVRLLGLSQSKVNGVDIFSYLESSEEGHLDLVFEKYRNGVSAADEMVRVKRDDKREAWALLSLFGFKDVAGERIGLMTLVDITKQKRAEDAKSEFVSLASHQLRTPIAGMKWSAELLQMDNPEKLNPRQLKYIERLLVSIRRMALLIDDFLRVSRFELGTFQAEYKKVQLRDLCDEIVAELEQRVQQKGIHVETFYDTEIDEVVSDSNLLRMIITNLYSNAVKYTREGGTIHLGYVKKEDELHITVTDNGMGIPVEDQENIFSKLFRASNATRDVPDGTGLGLYIVKEAVTVLDGRITFSSSENIGTTFEVVLPILGEESITRQ